MFYLLPVLGYGLAASYLLLITQRQEAGEDEGDKEEAREQGAEEKEVIHFLPCPLASLSLLPPAPLPLLPHAQYLFSQTVF
ncbi:MAG: hypothetical protein V7K69_25875 [Nostoc sp.]|uniref:hypothetical protein n=1 Tax=Nostoc sp. TaxID=1180 RepID=UPI002FF96465